MIKENKGFQVRKYYYIFLPGGDLCLNLFQIFLVVYGALLLH